MDIISGEIVKLT